jgi:DNA invertase Pin-like site-specific DNA recombinase
MASPKRTRTTRTADTGVIEALPYYRVSSDEQEQEGLSLPAQLANCRRYAAEKGWAIGEEYKDVLTGTRDDRPDYQRLLNDIRRLSAAGRRVVVVVSRLDRFGRKVLERVRAREELKALGVAVHTVAEGGEVSDLVANILASVAEEEVRRLGERISEVIAHTVSNGWHPVGRPPWGLRWRPATDAERREGAPRGALEEAPDEAPAVREAFCRAADGESIRSIARWVAALPASARNDRALSKRRMQDILRNPIYVGRFPPADGALGPLGAVGRWPALVDDATFHRVQERMARHREIPRQASNRYLLTSFLRCARCGTRMTGSNQPYGGPRYSCSAHALGADAPVTRCTASVTGRLIDQPVIDKVVQVIDALTADPRLRPALRREWQNLREPKFTGELLRELRRQEGERGRAKKRFADAAVKLVDGDLDKEGYAALRQRVERDLVAAEAEIARLRAQVKASDTDLPPLDVVLDEIGLASAFVEAPVSHQRDILARLLERVEPVRIAYGRYRPEITWTPVGQALVRIAEAVVAGPSVAA